MKRKMFFLRRRGHKEQTVEQTEQIVEQTVEQLEVRQDSLQDVSLDQENPFKEIPSGNKEDVDLLVNQIYLTLKNKKFSDPISLVSKCMEVAEKASKLTGNEKKEAVLLAVRRINEDLGIISTVNLEYVIDAICFAMKYKPKINLKKLSSKLKSLFMCRCFSSDSIKN